MSKILHLHLKYEYFDAIKRGEKIMEFRLSCLWERRLELGEYTHMRLYRGYQKVSENTVIDLPYLGFETQVITHEHFGENPARVCAIPVCVSNKLNKAG